MPQKPVIYDGDMGGDDLWAIAMLLAHRDSFNILGISTVFGNVSQPLATRNAQNFLHWLGIEDIPVVQGEDTPHDSMRPFGDDAYGENGVGGYILPESPFPPKKVDIADWLYTQLYSQSGKTTVFATGPATNIAKLILKYPDAVEKMEEVIFMGGAINPPGKDGQPVFMDDGIRRIGNITPLSEFNAYQDPHALNILIRANAPLTFIAADVTQYMVLTPDRQDAIKALHPVYGPAFHQMLMAVEHLDRTKFGVDGPFIHDPNVVIYALAPELYGQCEDQYSYYATETAPKGPQGDRRGQITRTPDKTMNSHIKWIDRIDDTEQVFDLMVRSLRETMHRGSDNPAPLEE